MALADIINRIEADADTEARELVATAEKHAAEKIEAAEKAAAASAQSAHEAARRDAEIQAARTVVAARLAVRDGWLSERRALVDQALAAAVEALAAMPADKYVAVLAREVAKAATGGEAIRFGSLDRAHANAVIEAVEAINPGLNLRVSADEAPFEHGALVEGDRVRSELSLEAIVASRRDDLELTVASVLFGGEA